MACQPKGETSNRNRGFQWRLLRYPSLDPRWRRTAHDRSADFPSPINYLLSTSSYRLVHPRVCQFRPPNLLSHNALQPIPTVAWGAPAYPKTRKPKTQNPSKMPAIKPHQTASTGGGSRFRIGFHPPPDPSSINYHLSTLFPGASVTMLPLTFHSPPIFFSGTTALPIRAE
jgi:hypothetical protein